MRNKLRIELLLLVCVALIIPVSATSGAKGRNEVFSALAQLPVEGSTTNVKIYIDGYSTPQDAERLHALHSQRQSGLRGGGRKSDEPWLTDRAQETANRNAGDDHHRNEHEQDEGNERPVQREHENPEILEDAEPAL